MRINQSSAKLPYLSKEEMIEVDRAMIEDYEIQLVQMMENAGRALAYLAKERFLENKPINRIVTILAGTGGNGGGALVSARHLHNYGADVKVITTKLNKQFSSVPAHQLMTIQKMGIPIK
jgi:NAD(P)H-hydrate epimerase